MLKDDDLDLDRLIRFPPHRYYISLISSFLILLGFVCFSVILNDGLNKIYKIEVENVTVVHDTVRVMIEAPKIYNCWSCNRVLSTLTSSNSIKCCDFEYRIVNKELVAKKVQ